MNLKRLWSGVALAALLAVAPGALAAPATLDEDIENAIVLGLAWLDTQQQPDGAWGLPGECDRVGQTGLVLLKFETRAIELGLDPLGPAYEYADEVAAGLDYILANAKVVPIGPQPAGDPDTNGNGIGMAFVQPGCEFHETYNTALALMALANSGHPELYGLLVQDGVDYFAWAQADDFCGVHRGGWRYVPDCNSDNSNSGYVTLALGYATAPPPHGFGAVLPDFVRSELSLWLDVIQDDVNGDADDGGSWYDPYSPWVNILKTGNLIYELGLVGDGPTSVRVQDALDYVERHWFDPGFCGTGWLDHRQAMFTLMKGLEGLGIDLIDRDLDGVPEHDWFAEVAGHLVATQVFDGSWPSDCWSGPVMSTAWALLTLEKSVPQLELTVPVDIKPTSCPNPLNVKSSGVVPVAILGTADLDVTWIDPASIQLAGVAPIPRWSVSDVATPYEPFTGKQGKYDCNTMGPDGFMDLVLHFKTQALVAALGPVADGDVLVLDLTGSLKPEFGGTPFHGEDVVWIINKTKK